MVEQEKPVNKRQQRIIDKISSIEAQLAGEKEVDGDLLDFCITPKHIETLETQASLILGDLRRLEKLEDSELKTSSGKHALSTGWQELRNTYETFHLVLKSLSQGETVYATSSESAESMPQVFSRSWTWFDKETLALSAMGLVIATQDDATPEDTEFYSLAALTLSKDPWSVILRPTKIPGPLTE